MMAAGKIGIASGKGVVGCEKCRIERLRVTDVEAHSQSAMACDNLIQGSTSDSQDEPRR